jgi:CTP synthase (EC 6.3.4.2)
MRFDEGVKSTFYVHVGLAPILPSGELKTKPIQHSVQELRRIGIQPDALIARSMRHLDEEARHKLALHSNIPPNGVFSCPFLETSYEIPLMLNDQGFTKYLLEKLDLDVMQPDLSEWALFVEKLKNRSKPVRIAMIGKYTKLRDSYVSIIEALNHASAWNNVKPELIWMESTDIEKNPDLINELSNVDGAIILPGFGRRGAEGKIEAIKYLREEGKPTLGICFGMQLMVVEAARNLAGLKDANSSELDPNTPHPVITLAPEQVNIREMGGTLRLGAKKIIIVPGTLAWRIYGVREIYERHRHRYVVNPKYVDVLEASGIKISGYSEDEHAEIIEFKSSELFYLGLQAHPEFKSRPLKPSPVFHEFIKFISKNSLG